MTFKEAEQLYHISFEIDSLKLALKEFEKDHEADIGVKAVNYDGMPHGSGVSDPMALSDKYLDISVKVQKEIKKLIEHRQNLRAKMIEYIKTLDESDIRAILIYRCCDGMSWGEIGNKMNMHRTTVSKKYYSFFKKRGKENEGEKPTV